jgi:hypothetical protein
VGAQSKRREFFLKSCSTVYSLRDFTRRFSNLYLQASKAAVEA